MIDLGCAECKFVKELVQLNLRRVIGVDLDKGVIETGSNYFKPNFDEINSPYFQRTEPILLEVINFVIQWLLTKSDIAKSDITY